ncbi:hypothetical protein LPJ72_005658 [Coemansia sp. Benny D160-2]|nr:hypothetical protein LPJ72_005658 [Coemansia sp. Benny D160-2]
MNYVGIHNTTAARTLVTVLASIALGISGITTALCVWLCIKRRELLRMTIYRVILAIQILMVLKSIINLIGPHVNANTNASCRVYVFFNLVINVAPLNLSVFAILYFQAVLLHNVQLHKRWPRILVAVAATVLSIVPELFVLFIPARMAGMRSFCQFYAKPSSTRHFAFQWCVFYIWVSLAAIIGLCSITTMVVAIICRSRDACDQMTHNHHHHSHRIRHPHSHADSSGTDSRPPMAAESGSASYGSSGQDDTLQSVVVEVVKESRKRRRRSSNIVVAKTMCSIIWFPIAPIITLGFNTVYSIVWYKTGAKSYEVFIVDCVLQFLSVPLMAMTFYLSPPARRALRKYLSDRKRKNSLDTLNDHYSSNGLPPSAAKSSSSLTSSRFGQCKISDFCRAMNPEYFAPCENRDNKADRNDNDNDNENGSRSGRQLESGSTNRDRQEQHSNRDNDTSSDSESIDSVMSTLYDYHFDDDNEDEEEGRDHEEQAQQRSI